MSLTPSAHERDLFIDRHPKSLALSQACASHFLFGVPLHWMRDWPTPATLFVDYACGAQLRCADGQDYSDFCLGDTGAMFGHSPIAVVHAIAEQASRGLTTMLPGVQTPQVGQLLQATFGLQLWQLAMTASDANRFMLRWCRAVTRRPQVLVFDGCYHGAVDDTLVDLHEGATWPRPSVLGQVHNHATFTRVIPFNDLEALRVALSDGQVACLLAEPALTNCGMVLPDPGFWEAASALCCQHGTLLVLDETHTLSTGLGGYARTNGLQPDAMVIGKAVAGGLPCAVYGMKNELAQRMVQAKASAPEGHSGIGTTLSGNALTMAALHASLTRLHTPANYQHMTDLARTLQSGLHARIEQRRRPWSVVRLGARVELQFMPRPPRNAQQVRLADAGVLESALHLFMLNRGVLLTPFHCMMLISPATTADDVAKLLEVFDQWLVT